jgi:hypothetical protein
MQLPLASGDTKDDHHGITNSGNMLLSTHQAIPPRPRRLWKINDTSSLKPLPTFYPPLDANCSTYISDGTPPSVVAVRIAECLTRRSVSVEYDEESATATCMTMDRCHFVVQLWRSNIIGVGIVGLLGSGSNKASAGTTTSSTSWQQQQQQRQQPAAGVVDNSMSVAAHDLLSMSLLSTNSENSNNNNMISTAARPTANSSQQQAGAGGIIVEVMRLRGDVMTFHRNVYAILQAALSHDSGADKRGIQNKPQLSSPFEFPRWTAHHSAHSTTAGTPAISTLQKQKDASKKLKKNKNANDATSVASSTTAASYQSSSTMKLPLPPSNGLLQPNNKLSMEEAATRAIMGMEQAMELLRKDRLDAQVLGMERLVALTDRDSSGIEIAMYTTLTLVGAPIIVNKPQPQQAASTAAAAAAAALEKEATSGVTALRELHQDWIIGVIVYRQLPGQSDDAIAAEKATAAAVAEATAAAAAANQNEPSPRPPKSYSGCAQSMIKDVNATAVVTAHHDYRSPAGAAAAGAAAAHPQHQNSQSDLNSETIRVERELEKIRLERIRAGDEHHGGTIRALALRCLANGLSLLAELQPKLLPTILTTQAPQLSSKEMLRALVDDAEGGASRPPGVAVTGGSQLASQHEAALAIRCLRIIGEFNATAKKRLLNPNKLALLPLLEKARIVGQATHVILEQEAQQAYLALTEADRSC